MKLLTRLQLVCLLPFIALSQPAPTGIHATAQCESLNTNVLGIKDLLNCNIGLTNYTAGTVLISQAMIREFFPLLSIEDPGRAMAVADKAFNASKKSRAIAALNFLSPLAVAIMGGGLIHASVEAVASVSLANSAAQSFKGYLIGQQPNEAAFLPNLPAEITLTPYGTSGFSGVWTVLGSITFTQGAVVTGAGQGGGQVQGVQGQRMKIGKGVRGPVLTWQGQLPAVMPAPAAPPAPAIRLAPGQPCPAGFLCGARMQVPELEPTPAPMPASAWVRWAWPEILGMT